MTVRSGYWRSKPAFKPYDTQNALGCLQNKFSYVEEFVERRAIRDFDKDYKGVPVELESTLCPEQPLYRHQKEAIAAILENKAVLLDIFPRGGKTRIILEAFEALRRRGECHHMVVVCYNEVSVKEWEIQASRYTPHLVVGHISSSIKNERIKQTLSFKGDIFLLTYGQLFSLFTDLAPVRGRGSRKGARRKYQMVDKERIAAICRKFDMAVYDESREIGSAGSMTFRMCRMLSYAKVRTVCMSGTPFSGDPAPLWSQGFVLDRGATFGEKFLDFQRMFYIRKSVPFGSGYIVSFDRRKAPYIRKLFKNLALSYDSAEVAAEFPPVTCDNICVPFAEGAHVKAYLGVKHRFVTDLRNLVKVQNPLLKHDLIKSVYSSCRQIASGFMYLDKKEGLSEPLRFLPIPKMDETLNLIKEIYGKSKVVVFFHFTESGKMLVDEIKKLKIPYVSMFENDDSVEAYQRFTTDPECRILLANAQKGGVGLNLSVADYLIFYEPPPSLYIYQQAIRRVLVPGKKTPVFVYQLYTGNSVEEALYKNFTKGVDLWESITGREMDLESALLAALG